MKRIFAFLVAILFSGTLVAQDTPQKLPAVELKALDGTTVNAANLSNDGKPIIINFWATWCAPCKKELNNINELYPDWVSETGVKIIAISIDDSRTSSRVKPYVDTQGWEYTVLIDQNKDFFRAMNGVTPPLTFLIDGEGNIVYTHNGYSEGDEDELYEHVLELTE